MEEANLKNTKITNDLNEENLDGINVWGQSQQVLEEQALRELEIFSENPLDQEEGLISDEEETKQLTNPSTSLDVTSYIKRQEELRKQQEYKRSLQVTEKSKSVAQQINEKNRNKRKNATLNTKGKKMKIDKKKEISNGDNSGSEYFPSDECNSDDEDSHLGLVKGQRKFSAKTSVEKVVDDGSVECYKKRLNEYYKRLEDEMNLMKLSGTEVQHEDMELCPGLRMDAKMWNNLYSYQRDGVEWLWNLHEKSTGGLLGDEMGLGKTVQVIAFLYTLHYSRIVSRYCSYTGLGPCLIVAPTTVLHQWVQHFHEWAPEFRVALLHQSGSYTGHKTQLIKDIYKTKGILVTSYLGILKYKGLLTELDWHYVILDEGHKIRNPKAKITVAAKQFRTPHRIMLTGSPMQNNLQELWSLFDFIIPGILGTLSVFLEHFVTPIMQGGYSNATPMQEATALSMATALKNMITPYLLRRSKAEVRKDISLPHKSEQVLFCSLTDEQHDLYKGYLMSDHVSVILGRGGKGWFSENQSRANILVAITALRKICNHPDVYLGEVDGDVHETAETDLPLEKKYGYYKRSGKMVVVSALLKIWKKQGHRVLLFTQTRAMIGIFEDFLQQQGYKYLKMDGTTSISSRQALIDTFNQDSSFDVFLLTTRVGGLGVNLTGANRVIIYDPDWNPATDTQARERAWRIGQEKQVTIYRLISAGTIEEKMYQRQVWKQLLSNKVLLDPKTQKFFKTSDLHDLFSIQEQTKDTDPETANIFYNSRVTLQERIKEKSKNKKSYAAESTNFSTDKIKQMKLLAQEIAKKIGKSENSNKNKPVHQLDEEIEKEVKLQEKEHLKKYTPQELLEYNRSKLLNHEDSSINRVDDFETDVSFTKALEISEKASKIYHDVKVEKVDIQHAQRKYNSLTGCSRKSKKKKHKKKEDTLVDSTGKVDGVKVDGVVKTETKKGNSRRSQEEVKSEPQDQYVLDKLFSKKGVHTVLQHDVIVGGNQNDRPNKFRVHSEAEMKTDLALQALRKSRLNKWRW